jgi:restriction endonuclease S subunit
MHIKDIAEVVTGYTFRGAIKADNGGNTLVFQAKDLVRGTPFTAVDALTKISHDGRTDASYLRKNDVLLVARGMKSGAFRSTVFASEVSNVIASSSIHIMRVTAPDVMPEYVSHFMNSKEGQDALIQIISGSYIGAVPRRELEEIEIPMPPLRKQAALVHLYQNLREQERVLDRKREIAQNIIAATFKTLTYENGKQ